MKTESFKNGRLLKAALIVSASAVVLSGCSFSPYTLPLPGGAKLGNDPYTVTVNFRDALDLVPQSAVRVNDVAVGKVTKVKLNGWTAAVTVKINRDAILPDNAEATIRQTSLLGEKFVSLAAPASGSVGRLGNGDVIPLQRAGRNPEIEEVLGAASLLFNGGGLEKTNTIVKELNKTMDGNEPEIRDLLSSTSSLVGQLDNNKQALITSLEKVNNLAVQTNKQTDAITGALDNLPAALKVVNDQREQLVTLLKALNHLGDVATNVVKDSKANTVADLKALGPVLKNLADSGDDLAKSLLAGVTYPFTDAAVGGSVQAAKNFHTGDFANLQVSTNISADNLVGLLGLSGGLGGAASSSTSSASSDPLSGLADLVGGLVPKGGLPDLSSLTPGAKSSTAPGAGPTTAPSQGNGLKLPQLCSILGSCRVAPASVPKIVSNDLGLLLIEPMVAS